MAKERHNNGFTMLVTSLVLFRSADCDFNSDCGHTYPPQPPDEHSSNMQPAAIIMRTRRQSSRRLSESSILETSGLMKPSRGGSVLKAVFAPRIRRCRPCRLCVWGVTTTGSWPMQSVYRCTLMLRTDLNTPLPSSPRRTTEIARYAGQR